MGKAIGRFVGTIIETFIIVWLLFSVSILQSDKNDLVKRVDKLETQVATCNCKGELDK